MDNLHYFLIGLCLIMEFASDVDTSNIGKKFALLLIIIGASLEVGGRPNGLIEVGILGYLMIDVLICYMSKRPKQ